MSNGLNKLEGQFEGVIEDIREIKQDLKDFKKSHIHELTKIRHLEGHVNIIKENKKAIQETNKNLIDHVNGEQKWRIALVITFTMAFINMILKIQTISLGGG